MRAFILQRVWQAGPPVYSDINFMLLGIAIERLTGRPLDEQPLPPGLDVPPRPGRMPPPPSAAPGAAACMRGEVHDENAFALGGASGHAGLFGTIDGVLDFALDAAARRGAGSGDDADAAVADAHAGVGGATCGLVGR